MPRFRILDIGEQFGYPVANIFDPWEPEIVTDLPYLEIKRKFEAQNIHLVCFGGGLDISPSMYGHNLVVNGAERPGKRDLFEREIWKLARLHQIPILGICRGAQMVCVMSGGALIQDIAGHTHGSYHPVTLKEGDPLIMSSYHHQMMFPFNVKNYELLGWVNQPDKRKVMYAFDDSKIKIPENMPEPEIVYFPDTNALGVQPHPEYRANPHHEEPTFVRNLVDKYLLKGLRPQ